ncbi:stage II sporulation protein R [Orenia marismortui]|uniref:Stage II sporulation protein R n=1 Tax=Orenia marismortui TaxID=46469 RepID=A0A4R8H1Y3_9FIRM|nr:stage II sporulation protein R [Orenia marismortui]TDX48434.1 stage II sporulation protein R [Orenia marismortui]
MRRIYFITSITITLILLFLLGSRTAFVLEDRDYNPSNLLRLHVIANSNSLIDQSLKREVRDKIIESSKTLFEDIENITEASNIVRDQKDHLIEVAEQVVKDKGFNYKVDINVGMRKFPTRTYGNITLPSGDYQAVNVVIGEGEGANWWCVLFPPLCFVDSVEESSPEILKAKANQIDDEKIDIQFKFKFVEYIKKHPDLIKKNLKLAEIFSSSK